MELTKEERNIIRMALMKHVEDIRIMARFGVDGNEREMELTNSLLERLENP